MAKDLNKFICIGRITQETELRTTPNGMSVCDFSIAVNNDRKKDGQEIKEVSFFNCTAWSKGGELIAQYCNKGDRIGIEGRLKQESWEDQDGKKRSNVKIIVESFQFLQGKDGSTESGAPDNANNKPFQDDDIPF